MVEGLAPPTRAVAHSQVTICRRLRIQYVFPHMCGVNQFWIIVFFAAVKPANNILFCIELIQRPESSLRRHKLGLTDQSIRSNDDKTLTLLIGIKADLLQFILYPDRLSKWSNSLIILETETSKWSKYRIISSACNEILWLWSWILIDTADFLMACAKGSRDKQNNKGESWHPCLVPRCKGDEGEIILPVMTDAAGEWYNVLIIEIKCSPKPKHCRTAHI